MLIDDYGYVGYSERELVEVLRKDPKAPVDGCVLLEPTLYNAAIDANYADLAKLKIWSELDRSKSVEEFHAALSGIWVMPNEYVTFDIAKWLLEQCNGEAELQRMGEELLLFVDRNLLGFLCYLKYMVDTFRKHGVVLGLGRGSSVASFALYKIGVHKVNSLEFDLNIREFLK